jgi:Tol biopolymer transport system component
MDFDCTSYDLSRDGKMLATLMKGKDNYYHVEVSDPLGSPLRAYTPAPFAGKEVFNGSSLHFSPDEKKILLFREGDNDKFGAWLLPYPAGNSSPRLVLRKLPANRGSPTFSWMPDSRHLVVSLLAGRDSPSHLWMADSESNDLTPITTGTATEFYPWVAPDGKSLLYTQEIYSLEIVSLSVEDGGEDNDRNRPRGHHGCVVCQPDEAGTGDKS